MYSGLAFTVDGEQVEFSAYELIVIAQEVVSTLQAEAKNEPVKLPDHAAVDKSLDDSFWTFTHALAEKLEESYGVSEDSISKLLVDAYVNPVNILRHSALLNTIKSKQKPLGFDIHLKEHIAIPMQLIEMNSIKQWIFIAKHLADNYLTEGSLAGWWFRIGGRVIRLRNDVEDGALLASNKQFYAADHGWEKDIFANTKCEIHRCIKNFTWGDKGTYVRAFRFWQFFILSDLKEYKNTFIERLSDDDLKNEASCHQLFLTLQKPILIAKKPLAQLNLSKDEKKLRANLFQKILAGMIMEEGGFIPLDRPALEWIQTQFIAELTGEIIKSKEQCRKLLKSCCDRYSSPPVPFEQLSPEKIKARGNKFDSIFKFYLDKHQSSLREEFIAYLDDDIAHSEEKCQLLLQTLASRNKDLRGTADEAKWQEIDVLDLGSRIRLDAPELTAKVLSEEKKAQYEKIFDDVIEKFRYVTQAIIQQYVFFMQDARNPFHTQVRQMMPKDDAENYILTHALYELAKKINHGKHEPLFRELSAYGDRAAGNSYHRFESSLNEYFKTPNALNNDAVAAKIRSILRGEAIEDESLGFLPSLTAAWFISETARNPLTTMTSLMLLDMIESNVILEAGEGKNWYCLQHALIHPLKSQGVGKVKDLYDEKKNIDEFSGCHPMVNAGSVVQTLENPVLGGKLAVSRQKEGNLIAHWLETKLKLVAQEEKDNLRLQAVAAKKMADINNEQKKIDERKTAKAAADKKLARLYKDASFKKAIGIDINEKDQVKVEELKLEINKYNDEIKLCEQKKLITDALKIKIRKDIIEPLLYEKMSTLDNLLISNINFPVAYGPIQVPLPVGIVEQEEVKHDAITGKIVLPVGNNISQMEAPKVIPSFAKQLAAKFASTERKTEVQPVSNANDDSDGDEFDTYFSPQLG